MPPRKIQSGTYSIVQAPFEAPVSEEQPPSTCDSGKAAFSLRCTGSYCDNVAIQCLPMPGSLGDRRWTRWFSEEGHPHHDRGVCKADEVMTGIACDHDYCDNVSIECSKTDRPLTACTWQRDTWISEEQGPLDTSGKVIRGIACKGSYCDDKAFLTCHVN